MRDPSPVEGVLTSYFTYSFPYELLGVSSFLAPIYGVLLAVYFRKSTARSA